MRTILFLLFALPLAAQTPPAATPPAEPPATATTGSEQFTGSVDFGYRWISGPGGDFSTYRSVVNLGDGPKLFGLNFTFQPEKSRLADRIDVQATSWGGDPYNTARIEARKEGWYNFRWDYRNIAYFNFLPSFADPSRDTRGFFLNQRAYDTFLRNNDFDITLFPGKRIVPYASYSRNSNRGHGTTNFIVDSNEYTVPDRFDSHSDLFRAGVRFEFNRIHITVEQGVMNFADGQTVAATQAGTGNVTTPILGQRLSLTTGSEAYHVDGGGSFSKVAVSANPVSWVNLYGQFLYSQPHTDVRFSQTGTGVFVDFATFAFYTGLSNTATGLSKQPHPSGSFAVELRPWRKLRIMESFMTDRLHSAGSAVLLDQLVASGATPSSSSVAAANLLVMNYNQQEFNVLFDATKRLTLRGGHRYVWGDTSAPASLVLGREGQEAAELRRHVGLAGFTYRTADKLRLSFDYEGTGGDRSFFRASLNEYQRGRVQARYQLLASLGFTANFNVLSNRNPTPGIDFHFLSRDNTLSAYWTPKGGKKVNVLAEYSRATVRSELLYLIPSTITASTSLYREKAHTGTLMAEIPLPGSGVVQPKLDLGGSFYTSGGTRPSSYYQPFGKVAVPIHKHVQWNAEWRWYSLGQSTYQFEGFRSHQFVTGFRLSM